MLKDKLQEDLKTSMLARDSFTTDVLKGLKTAIQYEEVAKSKREEGLNDDEILAVFKKESKKRQDSIDMYTQGNNLEQADKETKEKAIIDAYLPAQLSEDQVNELIDSALSELGISEPTRQDMGKIMGAVKSKGGPNIDGSTLARLVSNRLA
jgi:uncharacterized protein YqeY